MTQRRRPRTALSRDEKRYIDSLIDVALYGRSDPAVALAKLQNLTRPVGTDAIPEKPLPREGVNRRIEIGPTGTEIAIVETCPNDGSEVGRIEWRAKTPDEFWQEIVLHEDVIREALSALKFGHGSAASQTVVEAAFLLGGALARLADIRDHSDSQLTGQRVRQNLGQGRKGTRETSDAKCQKAREELRRRAEASRFRSMTDILNEMSRERDEQTHELRWGCLRSLMKYCGGMIISRPSC